MTRVVAFSLLLLAACTKQQPPLEPLPDVAQPPPKAAVTIANPRTEPIFYNGKTYQLTFGKGQGGFAMRVKGMTAAQQKDAVAVATSSTRYFLCKEKQDSKVTVAPTYADGMWSLSTACV